MEKTTDLIIDITISNDQTLNSQMAKQQASDSIIEQVKDSELKESQKYFEQYQEGMLET